MSVLRANDDVPGLDTPRQDETVLHVRIVRREVLRGSRRVRPEDEDRAVRVLSDRSRHDDLAPRMRLANETQMLARNGVRLFT